MCIYVCDLLPIFRIFPMRAPTGNEMHKRNVMETLTLIVCETNRLFPSWEQFHVVIPLFLALCVGYSRAVLYKHASHDQSR